MRRRKSVVAVAARTVGRLRLTEKGIRAGEPLVFEPRLAWTLRRVMAVLEAKGDAPLAAIGIFVAVEDLDLRDGASPHEERFGAIDVLTEEERAAIGEAPDFWATVHALITDEDAVGPIVNLAIMERRAAMGAPTPPSGPARPGPTREDGEPILAFPPIPPPSPFVVETFGRLAGAVGMISGASGAGLARSPGKPQEEEATS